MKKKDKVVVIVFLFFFLMVSAGLIYTPIKYKVLGDDVEIRLLKKTTDPGGELPVSVYLDGINVDDGVDVRYKIIKNSEAVYEETDKVFQKKYEKDISLAGIMQPGIYNLTVDILAGEEIHSHELEFKMISFTNWWISVLVFVIIIIIVHTAIKGFTDVHFHEEKIALKEFHEILKKLKTKDYHEARKHFTKLEEAYFKIKNPPKHVHTFFNDAHTRVKSLRVRFLMADFDRLYRKLLRGRHKDDLDEFKRISRILISENISEKKKKYVDDKFRKIIEKK